MCFEWTEILKFEYSSIRIISGRPIRVVLTGFYTFKYTCNDDNSIGRRKQQNQRIKLFSDDTNLFIFGK